MSRSVKKIQYIKTQTIVGVRKKQIEEQRRHTKNAIHHEKDVMPELKEVFNTYNFVDFKQKEFENPKSKQAKKLKRK